MTDAVKGLDKDELDELFAKFHALATGDESADKLGKLEAFSGIRDYPTRVKCATLAWHTLRAALRGKQGATTE